MRNIAEVFLGSSEIKSAEYESVYNPFDHSKASEVAHCSIEVTNKAVEIAHKAFVDCKKTPLHRKIAWLNSVADQIEAKSEIFAQAITLESAKPIASARVEVARTIETIRLTAMEALNLHGELFNSDAMPSGSKTMSFYKRVPIGVVVAITPFNFPLNLVAHKIAPALVAGNSVVLKPAPQTPYCGYLIAKEFIESPFATKDALSVVYGDSEVGNALITHPLASKISFTGSVPVGKIILKNAGLKRVSLELGGNAATYITKSADLAYAASRCALGAFGNSGQVCISLQRIYVDCEVAEEFAKLLADQTSKLRVGSCFDESVFMSALIDESAKNRALSYINSAKEQGARVLIGGKLDNGVLLPTILAGVTDDMQVVCEEVFAPIVSLVEVADHIEAFDKMNNSPFGLQFSVFTNDLAITTKAIDELECGGVVINDIPTLRFDLQPYGGIKESGLGREGPKFALQEMSEIKSVVIRS